MYVATINTPGYMPMDDDPPVFETAREAWEYLADERRRGEDDAFDWLPAATAWSAEYSPTLHELVKYAKWAGSGMVCDFEAEGTVYGDTPGYDGRHDVGLVYTVSWVEDE